MGRVVGPLDSRDVKCRTAIRKHKNNIIPLSPLEGNPHREMLTPDS